MERSTKLIITIVAFGLILGLWISPAMMIIAGAALWIILWLAQGGMSEGNPYKRMNMGGGVSNWAAVNQYQKNQDIEVRDAGSSYTAIFIFGTGLILIIIGLVWMWLTGSI